MSVPLNRGCILTTNPLYMTVFQEQKEDFAWTLDPLRGSSSPFSPLSRRGLSPIKAYDPDRPDGRLNLTANAFNQLDQYTNSPGRRGYCYAELAVFFPSGGCNHHHYSLCLPTEGWPG